MIPVTKIDFEMQVLEAGVNVFFKPTKVTIRSFVFRTINVWRGRHRCRAMQLFDTPDPAATPALIRRRSLKWHIS